MTDKTKKITIAVDPKIDEELEKSNYNKSKLINSLLGEWLKSDKKDVKQFTKKCD